MVNPRQSVKLGLSRSIIDSIFSRSVKLGQSHEIEWILLFTVNLSTSHPGNTTKALKPSKHENVILEPPVNIYYVSLQVDNERNENAAILTMVLPGINIYNAAILTMVLPGINIYKAAILTMVLPGKTFIRLPSSPWSYQV